MYFFFTADGRIDFRELVKDLATVFRTRIELRQVGVRDEAKVLNGIGAVCRPLCCSNFLGDFTPVSIRMAKDQNLSLNPTKFLVYVVVYVLPQTMKTIYIKKGWRPICEEG